jgi:hypothetical protein
METRTQKFRSLFSLSVSHAYFGAAPCPYILLEPDGECLLLMRTNRLLWKRTGSGLRVIAELHDKAVGAPRKQQAGPAVLYRFLVRLEDTSFFAITKLDLSEYPRQLFCYTNTGKDPRLSCKKYRNPTPRRESVLGTVDISLSADNTDTSSRKDFLLLFESNLHS